MIVGRTERLSRCYPTTILVAGGGVLKAQGDTAGATRNFRASIEILTNLIQEHGQNPSVEWDLDWAKAQLKG
jgi:hypothetical protein